MTKNTSFYYRLLLFSMICVLFSCNANPDKRVMAASDSTGKKMDTSLIQQETFPPEEFIEDLKKQATDIALVRLVRVDSVYGATKVFEAAVIKSYKGKLSGHETTSYAGRSEKNYPKMLSDTLVVFLIKHKKPLANLNVPNVYYSCVEDNAAIEPTPYLDSLLKKK